MNDGWMMDVWGMEEEWGKNRGKRMVDFGENGRDQGWCVGKD